MSAPVPSALRRVVRRRARGRCEYCRIADSAQVATFHCDHCRPRSHGGGTTAENLAWACAACNGARLNRIAAIDPSSGITVSLFNPRLDRWRDHFRWSLDRLRIVPLTATGRATEQFLRMNRPRMVKIRALMIKLGLQP